jgi:hypothetical protein
MAEWVCGKSSSERRAVFVQYALSALGADPARRDLAAGRGRGLTRASTLRHPVVDRWIPSVRNDRQNCRTGSRRRSVVHYIAPSRPAPSGEAYGFGCRRS